MVESVKLFYTLYFLFILLVLKLTAYQIKLPYGIITIEKKVIKIPFLYYIYIKKYIFCKKYVIILLKEGLTMDKRIKNIYSELYKSPKKKKYLAELFDVNPKTIENTINKYTDDIILDKELGAYRFNNLLPQYIPLDIFFNLFQTSIGNEIIKNDFLSLSKMINLKEDLNFPMILTQGLSTLAQKIIMAEVAINSNCILKIDYLGNSKPLDSKYIKPHKIIATGFTYYLYGSYDEKNENNVGQSRSLAFNGMHSLSPVKYIKDGEFLMEGIGNAYGLINKEKHITLKLEAPSANFFKREGQFNKENFDFISEEIDGSVIMKMYYNNIQEVVKLLQSWMPLITIHDNPKITDEVYKIIFENTEKLTKNYKK